MAESLASRAPGRLPHVDWMRGLAVVCMVLWHVVDAWHVTEQRDTVGFAAVVFFAGWAAPAFLFLAGCSLAATAARLTAQRLGRARIARQLVRRGIEVLALAHLFRLQSFLLNPNASWNSLLKPDILNVLGVSMVVAAGCWYLASTPRRRVLFLLLPAVAVAAVATPWAPAWHWPDLLPWRIEGYFRIDRGNAVFSLLPGLAYVLAGTYVFLPLVEGTVTVARFHRRAVIWGSIMLAVTVGSAWMPFGDPGTWWREGAMVALRVGAFLVALAAGWRLSIVGSYRLAPLETLGRTSLFVYWVHVEVAYGWISYPLHKALTLGPALAAWTIVMAALYWLSVAWLSRRKTPLLSAYLAAAPEAAPLHAPALRPDRPGLPSVPSLVRPEA
jgi:uncharacterized membrane protein